MLRESPTDRKASLIRSGSSNHLHMYKGCQILQPPISRRLTDPYYINIDNKGKCGNSQVPEGSRWTETPHSVHLFSVCEPFSPCQSQPVLCCHCHSGDSLGRRDRPQSVPAPPSQQLRGFVSGASLPVWDSAGIYDAPSRDVGLDVPHPPV